MRHATADAQTFPGEPYAQPAAPQTTTRTTPHHANSRPAVARTTPWHAHHCHGDSPFPPRCLFKTAARPPHPSRTNNTAVRAAHRRRPKNATARWPLWSHSRPLPLSHPVAMWTSRPQKCRGTPLAATILGRRDERWRHGRHGRALPPRNARAHPPPSFLPAAANPQAP